MSSADATPDPKPRVLLVEDDPMIAALVVDLLGDEGMDVVGPIASLAPALAAAAHEPLDAAVLDVNLGAETSFDVARLLQGRGIPYLYTTAFANHALPEIADAHCLAKPYSALQLMRAVRAALVGR